MQALDLNLVVGALERVLAGSDRPISLHMPRFGGNEVEYLTECIETGWVSSVGKFVDRFEAMLCEITGARHVIATVNGTAALHICLKLVGVEEKDEVLIPALTFIATANAVKYCGATPHFVDSETKTLGVDPEKLCAYLNQICEVRTDGSYNKRTGKRIRALMPMHTFGHPVDIEKIIEVCERFKLELVEDAAESLGSFYKGHHTGTFGRVSGLSFNGNKIVTTGGGGAVMTNDSALAAQAKHITTTAKVKHQWEFVHDQVGYNYRLPNINAALGCAQLEQLPIFIEQKRRLAERYVSEFQDIEGLEVFVEPEFAKSNYWLNTLLLDEAHAANRDALLELTNLTGVMTRPAWTLLHKLAIYQECPRMDLSVAERLERRIVNIPSSSVLGALNE